jgi:hypothetical protein
VAYKGIAKVQHYVPQFLLRNFGNGKKDRLYVFDKQMARSFRTNANNVASEVTDIAGGVWLYRLNYADLI